MKAGVIMSSTIFSASGYGRMDAGFLLLAEEHKALWQEIIAKFSSKDVVWLAKTLPYDAESAKCVFPTMAHYGRGYTYFCEKIANDYSKLGNDKRRYTELAIYCAVAATKAKTKLAERARELAEGQRVLGETVKMLADHVESRGAERLKAVLT